MRKYHKKTIVFLFLLLFSIFFIKALQNSNENSGKVYSLQEENKQFKEENRQVKEENRQFKEKYTNLKSKYLQIDSKLKALLSEKDKLKEEKSQLQEKNHSYIQDATRLHQLSEEMKEFENKVYAKKMTQMEKQMATLEQENKDLKHENHSFKQKKTDDYKENNNKGKIETRLEKLIRENNKLVVSMQNVLDSCANIRIIEQPSEISTEVQNKDLKDLFNKLERLMNENELIRNQEKTKDAIISDLKEKLEKKEDPARIADLKENIRLVEERLRLSEEKLRHKEAEIHSLEIKVKFYEENEAKLRTQLEFLSKDRGDLSILLETLHNKTNELDKLEKSKASPAPLVLKNTTLEDLEAQNQELRKNLDLNLAEIKGLKENIERNRLDLELERDLRSQYYESIQELETILRELMNEGEMFRHHVKKTISEENKKVLEKYRILLEEKPKE